MNNLVGHFILCSGSVDVSDTHTRGPAQARYDRLWLSHARAYVRFVKRQKLRRTDVSAVGRHLMNSKNPIENVASSYVKVTNCVYVGKVFMLPVKLINYDHADLS